MGLFRRGQGEDGPSAGSRYQLRQRLISIGDDYWIEDEQGRRAFRVNGKALRVRDTFVLEDPAGNEVAKIQERKLSVRDKDGDRTGRRLPGDGPEGAGRYPRPLLDGQAVATVSKRRFRARDTYGVEIAPGEDDALVLAISVCVDALSHRGN